MDGDPVTWEPSIEHRNDTGAGGESSAPTNTLGEIFTQLCPHYMAMGMTYYEFWHRNTACHYAYRKAWEERRKYRNWEMWMQGGYFFDALVKASPMFKPFGKGKIEPGEYPKEPYPITQKEARERAEEKRRQSFERALAMFERESRETLASQAASRQKAEKGSTIDAQEGG